MQWMRPGVHIPPSGDSCLPALYCSFHTHTTSPTVAHVTATQEHSVRFWLYGVYKVGKTISPTHTRIAKDTHMLSRKLLLECDNDVHSYSSIAVCLLCTKVLFGISMTIP